MYLTYSFIGELLIFQIELSLQSVTLDITQQGLDGFKYLGRRLDRLDYFESGVGSIFSLISIALSLSEIG